MFRNELFAKPHLSKYMKEKAKQENELTHLNFNLIKYFEKEYKDFY